MTLACSSISRIPVGSACVPRGVPRGVLSAGRLVSLHRCGGHVKACRAIPSPHARPSVNMTLISGSLSSYDDPVANPIDPAPTCFLLLAVTHAALGLYMLLRPETVIQTVYAASAGNSLVSSLMAMMGGMHLYASVFSHALHGMYSHLCLSLPCSVSLAHVRLAFMSLLRQVRRRIAGWIRRRTEGLRLGSGPGPSRRWL